MKIDLLKNRILFIFNLLLFLLPQILYSSEIFSIQAGVFSSQKHALNLVETLKKRGIECTTHETGGLYKVYCGEFIQNSDAYALKREFSSLGYKEAFIVSRANKNPHNPVAVNSPPKEPIDEVPQPHSPILLDRVVGVVNKEVITWSELYKMMEYEAQDQVKELTEDERMKLFKDSEADFLEMLIDMKLQLQEARRTGLEVFTEEITETIENIKNKYSMSHDVFLESIKKEGFSFDEYKKRLSEQILINKVINYQIRNKIVVSDDEVKKYMEANKVTQTAGESYRLRQIFFKMPASNEDRKIVEEKASLVIQKLAAGEDFSDLARVHSEDPSGKLGGNLGFINRSDMTNEFIEVLSGIKAGDFSKPFWTERGLHIIKLDEKMSEQNIDKVKEDIRNLLEEQRFLESYKSWIRGLREKAYIEILL